MHLYLHRLSRSLWLAMKLTDTGIAMKFPGPSENQRLAFLLENALAVEARQWKVPLFQNCTIKGTDISPFHYEQVVLWIGELTSQFLFQPETFALAVNILNRLLASVKAQVKYLRCIAVSCFLLAAKTSEEDEVLPSVKKLAVQSDCRCSTAEVLRMERIILDKLHWDLFTATPVDFLNTFHAMVMSNWPQLLYRLAQMNPSRHVAFLTRQLQHCMACHQLVQFKGSTLALVIITLELERLTPDWFPVITDLLKKAQVDSSHFIHCKELVDQQLMVLPIANAIYIFNPANQIIRVHPKGRLLSRNSNGQHPQPLSNSRVTASQPALPEYDSASDHRYQDTTETDEFYDGFQHLYNEDAILEDATISNSDAGNKVRQEEHCSPCPPLQPPEIHWNS
ncbi:cyclin-I2 isoform X2 [Microcaecilia unicolor]|uniref:Cyclin-I n=1 Tax=Microcaecilia unicolor TaxID=1415580 RepID=A0A6P7YQ20_9AMPH|nr:cyclin-I2 isoform X2 [Microcaecilia unicolor]